MNRITVLKKDMLLIQLMLIMILILETRLRHLMILIHFEVMLAPSQMITKKKEKQTIFRSWILN